MNDNKTTEKIVVLHKVFFNRESIKKELILNELKEVILNDKQPLLSICL